MVLLLFFSNHPFTGIDSFILELFKEAWECGYNNNNIEENGKITSGFSILIRQHYAFIDNLMRGNPKGHCPAR